MTTHDPDQIKLLVEQLEAELPDHSWKALLEVLQIVGVADMLQIQEATGFDRERVRRILSKIEKVERGFGPIVKMLNQAIPRPGLRGRAPNVFRLEEWGALALRNNDFPKARACELRDETAIAHAITMLHVHLAAQQARLAIRTDHELAYGKGKRIRPDHVITLPGGTQALFEIEQYATPELLRRIIESLRNKISFFQSQESKLYSTDIRMVVNLPRGKEWEKTLKVWSRACSLLADELKKALPFRLFAIPLGEFLDSPDWSREPQGNHWTLLPIQAAPETPKGEEQSGSKALAETPSALIQRSFHEDHLVLEALWEWFRNSATRQPDVECRWPDPEFFELIMLIYSASHDPHADELYQAAQPWASIYLLRSYLDMHPTLREAIQHTMHHNSINIRWNTSTIMHRMQVVVDEFMRYHGWRTDGALHIWVDSYAWETKEPRTFSVFVQIHTPTLLMQDDDQIVPQRETVDRVARALAWVLYALFAYSRHLGIKKPPFW